MVWRFGALIPPCLILAACGGGSTGGVASTPAPTASPSPTPSPTPTPTPSASANTSLLGPLVSETFASDSAQAAATFTDSGTGPGTASASNLRISYDASSGSYTLSNGKRTQTFTAANQVQLTTKATVYQRNDGTTVDTLTLTRPGTSGAFTYQYVGAGIWQRATTVATGVNGSLDAFTYGVTTPNATLPRTGSAGYAVDVIGLFSSYNEQKPNTLNGTGSVVADFAAGRIDTNGNFTLIRPETGPSGYGGQWSGTGTISSSSNSFTGALTVLAFTRMDGGFSGRFYGPTAGEVGISFWATGTTGTIGDTVAGALIGRQSASVVSGAKLADMNQDSSFVSSSASGGYESSAAGLVKDSSGNPRVGGFSGSTAWVDYTAGSDSYKIKAQHLDIGGSAFATYDEVTVGPADKLATQNDPRFVVYRKTMANGDPVEVKLYRPTGSNTELALSYLSFASLDTTSLPNASGISTRRITYMPFGYRTPANQVPAIGTGSYSGVLYGTGLVRTASPGAGSSNVYALTGTSSLLIDFFASHGTLTLNPVGTEVATGATFNFGSYDIAITRFSADLVSMGGAGTFSGNFYGPRAEEFAGSFSINASDAAATYSASLNGIAVGKQR